MLQINDIHLQKYDIEVLNDMQVAFCVIYDI
jgi:hypothetical protein